MRALPLFAVVLAACSGGTDDTADDTGDPVSCQTIIDETIPSNGGTDGYYRGGVEFHLNEPDATATIVTDIPGSQSTRDDGATIVWTPDAPLEPLTSYSATLEYCGGSPEISFSTSVLGTEIEGDYADFQDLTYALHVENGRFLAGEGVIEVAATLFTSPLLLGVTAVSDDDVTMRLALAAPDFATSDTQNFCARTLDLPPASTAESPFIEIGGQDVELDYADGGFTLIDLSLQGTLAPDGTYVGGAEFSLTVDAAELVDAFEFADVDALCGFSENLGVACEICPDFGSDTCITIVADRTTAELVPGLVLEEITAANTDSRCPDAP